MRLCVPLALVLLVLSQARGQSASPTPSAAQSPAGTNVMSDSPSPLPSLGAIAQISASVSPFITRAATPTPYPLAANGHASIVLGIFGLPVGVATVASIFTGNHWPRLAHAMAQTLNVTDAAVQLTVAYDAASGWVAFGPLAGQRRQLSRAADEMLLAFDVITIGAPVFAAITTPQQMATFIAAQLQSVLNDPAKWSVTFGAILDTWFSENVGQSRGNTEVLAVYAGALDSGVGQSSPSGGALLSGNTLLYVCIGCGAGGALLIVLITFCICTGRCRCCCPQRQKLRDARAIDDK